MEAAILTVSLTTYATLLLLMCMLGRADTFNWKEHARIRDEAVRNSREMATRQAALEAVVIEISRNQREVEMVALWADHHRWAP
jgi:hypothetical protein